MKIEFCNVSIRRGGQMALEHLDAVFDSSLCRSYAILGANGAGKSTLLEAIPGLLLPCGGEIRVDSLTAVRKNFTAIRKKVGMVFQNSDDQLFSQTVREDVAFGPINLHLPPGEIQSRTAEALELLGISALADRDLLHLSGGEKRRVALAGVLAMRPEAILLDEPTSMLDPRAAREFGETLNGLPALKLIASHDLEFIRHSCSECLVLKNGKIAACGHTADLLANQALLLDCGLA